MKAKRKKIERTPIPIPVLVPDKAPGIIDEDGLAIEIGAGLFQKWGDIDHLTREMMKQSCAFLAQEVLSGPVNPPYNGRFLISEHHAEWDELVYKHKRLCILAPRDHSKCAVTGEPILSASGEWVPIENWAGGELIAWDEKTCLCKKTYAPAAKDNGVQDVCKITTSTGRWVTVTLDHPLLTWVGWKKAQDLAIGGRIAVIEDLPKKIKESDQQDYPTWRYASIFWDEVVSVELMGKMQTWALSVPEFSTYISRDIVNHNTYFFDFAYPIWQVLRDPGGCGFIFSATQVQAERILSDIKSELENNPKLHWLIPVKKEWWSSTHIKLVNGHHIYARGFGTKVRGAHPSWIVVDDGLNDESMYSELVRKKQIDYFYTAISNMIIPGGQIIVVGTPFHSEDLYGDLAKNKEYVFERYAAIDAAGNALWPDRYDRARLDSKKKEIGGIRFAREFLCLPISDDASLFPGYLFQGDPTEQYTACLGMPKTWWESIGVTESYMGVDIAMSSSAAADFMVVMVVGVDRLGNRWIQEILREKGMGFQEQLSLIAGAARKYKVGLLFIEANQMQRVWGDELIRTTDLPIKKFITSAEKNTLDKGIPSLRLLFENKKFRIPRGDARSVELTDIWIDEMKSFTYANGKLQSVSGHDDTVAALWICDQAIKQGSFAFSFGAEDIEGDVDEEDGLSDKEKMCKILDIRQFKGKRKMGEGVLGENPEKPDSEVPLPFSVGFGNY